MSRWTISQGSSTVRVNAADHAAAAERGRIYGFVNPDSIVLDDDGQIWARRRSSIMER